MTDYYGNFCPPLVVGTEIELTCINDPENKHNSRFTIKNVLGRGGMSYVYTVEDSVAVWTLKEYCPMSVIGDPCALHREGDAIVVNEKYRENYDMYKENLIQASKYHTSYIKQHLSANINNIGTTGFYEGNNTIYIRSVYENGISYDKIEDADINFMFRIALATAKAVRQYHENNILLIDLKPENILVLQNSDGRYITDYIKFFDYDSMVTVDYAVENPGKLLYSDNAPPEFKLRGYGSPDFSSDIFEIGAMVYKRIHGKDHVSSIANGRSRYCDGREGTLLHNAPSSLISATNEFLSRTLRNDRKRRYQDIDKVINDLAILVNMSMPEHIYLRDKRQKPGEKFSGRKAELREIKRRLDSDNFVFLRGMGGVGKSALAKKFAHEYRNEYHTCQFVSYGGSVHETIGALDFANLSEADFDGNVGELLKAKTDHLDFCDSKTLIIVDNVDVPDDEGFDELLNNSRCNAKFIFTTRCTMNNYTKQTFDLQGLQPEDCKELFFNYWDCTEKDKKTYSRCVEELSEMYNGNALLLKLMADVVNSSMGMCTPCDVLDSARSGDYESVDCEIGYLYSDMRVCDCDNMTVINLLLKIFRIKNLDRTAFMILNNLSLVPAGGIECADFIRKSGFARNTFSVINRLVHSGWINCEENRISVHSLIADLVSIMYAQNSADPIFDEYVQYGNFLASVCEYIADDSLSTISQVRDRVAHARNLRRRCSIVCKDGGCRCLPVYQLDITAGRLLLSIRDYNGAAEHLECAASLMKQSSDVSTPDKISTDVLLCKAYTASGKYDDATECIERAVSEAVRYNVSCGENQHISVSSLLIYKGEILDLKGLYDDAIQLYTSILEAQGFDMQCAEDRCYDALTLAALFHLGNSLSDKGDTVEAQKYLDAELSFSLKADNGQESINTAITLAEIAENRLVSGDCRRALEDYSRAHEIMCRCAGEDDPKTRSIYYARIGVLSLIGETAEVIDESEKYVEHCRKLYGENSVQLAYAYKIYSEMLLQAGKVADAGVMIEKAVEIYDVILPVDNPDYATALLNKAEILYTVGRIEESGEILDSLSGIRLVSLVDNAIFHANYISLLTLTGEYEKAHELCSEYIAVSKTNRLNQLHLINAYNLMGNIYLRSSKSRMALEAYGEALRWAENMDFGGKINPNVWICRSNMAAAYLNLGLFNKAYSELKESLGYLQEYYPEGHQRLVNIYINMGKCCFAKGRTGEALDWFVDARELKEALGINGFDIMLELNSSLVYDRLGMTETAVEKCRNARDFAQTLWSQDGANIQLAVILADLGLHTARNGDTEKGAELITQALEMQIGNDDKMYYEHAVMYKYLADISIMKNDYVSAAGYMDTAIEVMNRYGYSSDVRTVDFCTGRAAISTADGRADEAKEFYVRALTLLSDAYDSIPREDSAYRLVVLLCSMGEMYALSGDSVTAQAFAYSAKKAAHSSFLSDDLTCVLADAALGNIHTVSGDCDEAEKCFGQVISVLKNQLADENNSVLQIIDSMLEINEKNRECRKR